MPTYEYECAACRHTFEKFQRMTEDPVRRCPKCRRLKVKRLIGSGVGIIFKGSGFYETDYKRGDGYKDAASRDKEPASTTTSDSKSTSSSSTKESTTTSDSKSTSSSSTKESTSHGDSGKAKTSAKAKD